MDPDPTARILALLALSDTQLLRQVQRSATTSRGPGGQKVNKTQSAVRLVIPELNVDVLAQKHRSRQANQTSALRRLRLALALRAESPPGPQIGKRIQPYLQNGLHIKDSNPDLAWVFLAVKTAFLEQEGDPKKAAAALGVTPSALSRFIKKHKELLAAVKNHPRRDAS